MPDPYRDQPAPRRRPLSFGRLVLRAVLWCLLVLAAAANMVASLSGMSTLVRLAFGMTGVACVILLVIDNIRARRHR
ncbi:hypothetical protein [Microtetraspora malaysiensis]|uniref:hypothetical protein n=1 Tax=Microtetraspora malaysiensis TaxID=161358 RepID=UPI000AEAFD0E|nr:hypothetical protein [Microtetraspora malaysiensis]